jgi:ribosome-associated heat shock protein Hsp15
MITGTDVSADRSDEYNRLVPSVDALPSETQAARRLDVWLDVACLFKTRSEAARAIEAGKVELNGQRVKAHRTLRENDEIVVQRGNGRKQTVKVRGFAEQHVPKAQARELYEDLTPPPTPEQLENRRIERLLRAAAGPVQTRAPDRRDRRALRRLKGKLD